MDRREALNGLGIAAGSLLAGECLVQFIAHRVVALKTRRSAIATRNHQEIAMIFRA